VIFDGYDAVARTRYSNDDIDWAEPAPHTERLPATSAVVRSKQIGNVFYILNSVLEPIDSTRDPEKVQGLIEHWQAVLYGGDRERPRGDDRRRIT
jgi:hypothetical protein